MPKAFQYGTVEASVPGEFVDSRPLEASWVRGFQFSIHFLDFLQSRSLFVLIFLFSSFFRSAASISKCYF